MKIYPKSPKMFPIYSFNIKWIEDIPPPHPITKYQHTQGSDLPLGRMSNGTQFCKIFRRTKTSQQLQKIIDEYCDDLNKEHINVELISFGFKFIERESWCLGWFSHYTFDTGQTDEEALNSFEEFVQRKELINKKARWEGAKYDPYCLMGAEERGRWSSGNEHYKDIPCRCEGCKKQGILRIAH